MIPFITAGLVLTILAVLAVWGFRRLMRRGEAALGHNAGWSIAEWLFSLKTHDVANIALTMQRAEQGTPAQHPLGSRPHVDWLDQIGFDPATLVPGALAQKHPVALNTVIGPKARRPLPLALPVIVAPMGYGLAVDEDVKVALAEAASVSGTAIVTGEGPYLPEERALAERWVLQLSRASWAHQPEVVRLADMVEIQLSQGAEAGIGIQKPASALASRMARDLGGQKAVIHHAPFRKLESWVADVRSLVPDVPLGIKIAGSHHLEDDLTYLTALGIDAVTLDGSTAGSAGSPAVISDHFGVTTALLTVRAHRWLQVLGVRDRVTLIVSGGVHDAADIAKLLALGADVVAVGSILLFALAHEEVWKIVPEKPPTALVLAHGSKRTAPPLNRDRAAEHVANWFEATAKELREICRAVGVGSTHDLRPFHLMARTPEAARVLGLSYDGEPGPWQRVAHSLQRLVEAYQEEDEALWRILQTGFPGIHSIS